MNNFSGFLVQYNFYFFLVFLTVDIVLAVWIFSIRKNIKKIFEGGSGTLDMDLEKVMLELRQNEIAFGEALKAVVGRVDVLEKDLPKDLRRIGLVRYNPFSDAGGDQSFALALLNDEDDGIVLSSLYGREMNRVYAKLIRGGKAQYQLTEEEKKAIVEAK